MPEPVTERTFTSACCAQCDRALEALNSPEAIELMRSVNRPAATGEGAMTLPADSATRKRIPLVTGCLDYFPAALAEVAKLSKIGNDKHNPGQPLHHARGKSMDHADCIGRHMIDRDTLDPDTGLLHMVEVCWRSLALLQEMLEARGAPLARGARLPGTEAGE